MKRIIIVFTILLAFQNVSAQLFTKEKVANHPDPKDEKLLSWGYFLGLNSYDFKFNYNEDLDDILVDDDSFGFHLGLVGDMRINDYLNLRLEPGVFFATRNLRYKESYFNGMDFNDTDFRGVFAINDEIIRDNDPNSPWTGNIAKMQTRGVFINFTFQ